LQGKEEGAFGGGSEITEEGKEFAECYMKFRKELYETGDILFKKHFSSYI
jgi:molybdenum-dependent DNA-binding transcriptional regulator ModE